MPASEPQPPAPAPAQNSCFPVDGLTRLARLILKGDVVFFLGAGFSLESEWNSGTRFIRRLLIRLEAMGRILGDRADAVRQRLRSTFDLASATAAPRRSPQPCAPATLFPYTDLEIQELGRRYFETNDWFCTAFSELLEIAAEIPVGEEARSLARIHATEESIRTQPGPPGAKKLDDVPLDTESLPRLVRLVRGASKEPRDVPVIRAAGKALFLDTMGFRNARIMAGLPRAGTLEMIAEAYGTRLLPRHHVIARLARDGLCGTTLTTNFDLLLEGAYRLAGFRDRHVESADAFPPTDFSEYARITSPREFFREGKAHRTAVLVKMHGCADTYRRMSERPDESEAQAKRLEGYLRSMVFTYREIQNWREDAWAADFLRTLLRTRTVVFAGYSLQDPVVHDTFRTVYEEMARVSKGDAVSEPPPEDERTVPAPARPIRNPTAADAPAFFFDILDAAAPDKSPFHAIEVLKAASDAVGVPRGPFGSHPNLLRFHDRGSGRFPNLDELYRWLFHLVLRFRQQECLRNDLRRTLTALHGEGRTDDEFQQVEDAFQALIRSETEAARTWLLVPPDAATSADERRQMGRIVSWSELFHLGLLREFAIVDQLRRKGGFRLRPGEIRRRGWYYPFMQNADWTCWGAVVELAVRRMVEAAGGSSVAVDPTDRIWAAAADHPTAVFLCPRRPKPTRPAEAAEPAEIAESAFPTLHALSIRFPAFDALRHASLLHGQPSTTCVWQLSGNDAPWRSTEWRIAFEAEPGRRTRHEVPPVPETGERLSAALVVRRPPPAATLWRWATRNESDAERRSAPWWLGIAPPPP